jgi:hypothetical protein
LKRRGVNRRDEGRGSRREEEEEMENTRYERERVTDDDSGKKVLNKQEEKGK